MSGIYDMTTIFFVNNDGGGFAEEVSVRAGTTIGELVASKLGVSVDIERFLVRVNRDITPASYVLDEGDRVTLTPKKIEGASL